MALAGNPNTGKSSVFNALTGLRQHTGNWPGKTVGRAEGRYSFGGRRFKLVDLPGTYSLLSASQDEEIARDFILFGRPDCTVVVVDVTALERNLNLVLQVLEITDRVVVCANLMDEARRLDLAVDIEALSRELGVPVVPTSARTGSGLTDLMREVDAVASGKHHPRPRLVHPASEVERAADELEAMILRAAPGLASARWVAYRLLDGDVRVRRALEAGELADLVQAQKLPPPLSNPRLALEGHP
ncbi:MAG TPA: FeoB small GTPase domain-containing protein [Anaerolineales bacterium]|nr:FeoB small GTPase domain-containing protein [Anaerolineales bacterium]